MTALPEVPPGAWETIADLAKMGAHPDDLPNAYRLTREFADREAITADRAAQWVVRIAAQMNPPDKCIQCRYSGDPTHQAGDRS